METTFNITQLAQTSRWLAEKATSAEEKAYYEAVDMFCQQVGWAANRATAAIMNNAEIDDFEFYQHVRNLGCEQTVLSR
jgi:hypothetical protein